MVWFTGEAHKKDILVYGVLTLIIFCFVCLLRPPIPMTDSGMFLYIGSHILHGSIPYRDIWDHKPPLIFYLNAFSLLFTPHSDTGITFLQACLLSLTACAVFRLLRTLASFGISVLCMSSYLSVLFLVYAYGNFPEVFFLPLQIAALLVFFHAQRKKHSDWWYVLFGVLCGVSILLKPNMIGVFVTGALILFLQWRQKKENGISLIRKYLLFTCGILLPLALTISYFFTQGGLKDFFQDMLFNFVYIELRKTSMLHAVFYGMNYTLPLMPFALIAWSMISFYMAKKKHIIASTLLLFIWIDFPIEILLSVLSKRLYYQYFLIWLLPSTLLMAYGLSIVLQTTKKSLSLLGRKIIPFSWICFIFLADLFPIGIAIYGYTMLKKINAAEIAAIHLIQHTTKPGDDIYGVPQCQDKSRSKIRVNSAVESAV